MTPLGFDEGLVGWNARETGGTSTGKGDVRAQDGGVVLREGDSFLVSLERTFVVPENPTVLSFAYGGPTFDTTDTYFINDAFEASLVDSAGATLVHAFATDRDSFFNVTEGLAPSTGRGASVRGTRVTADISQLFPGTSATLVFRLINNDSDTLTSVQLSDARLGVQPLELGLGLANDTAPAGSATDLYRSDKLTNDARLQATVRGDVPLVSLELQIDAAPFVDVKALLRDESLEFDPGALAPGGHTATLKATDSDGHTAQRVLEFRQNTGPVGKAGADLLIREGDSAQLDGSQSTDSEGLFGYQWTLPDGTTRSEPRFSRIFPQDGSYKFDLQVADTAGSTSSDEVVVEVENAPPVVAAIRNVHVAPGQTVELEAPFSDPGRLDSHRATIAWGDGTSEPAMVTGDETRLAVSAHAYSKAGTYEAELIVSDEAADTSTRFTVYVETAIPHLVPSAAVDDGDWAYRERGLWGSVPSDLAHRGDYRTPTQPGVAANTATWTLTGAPGRYEVFATWPEGDGLGAATYAIRDGNALLGNAERDQGRPTADGQYDGRLWASLGTFEFESGVGNVTLSSLVGPVVADGLIWVPATTDLRALSLPVPTPRPAAIPTAPDDSIEIHDLAPFEKTNLEVGTRFVVSGRAVAGAAAGGVAYVTVNGRPVDALDASGNFFHAVEALPGYNTLEVVAVAKNAARQVATIAFNGVRVEGIDLDQLADVSGSIVAEYGRTSLSQQSADALGGPGDTLHAALALRNRGIYPVRAPLLVGVKSLTDPTVLVRGAAGRTAEGIPYYDFSSLLARDVLSPTQKTAEGVLEFYNPQHVRFTYELVILGLLNRSPLVTTAPNVEAIVGRPYTYDLAATDPDGDPLTYSLLSGPQGLSIDRVSGAVRWAPTEPNPGNHVVAIRVEDGQGGAVEQRFTLSAIVALPNRPPVFVSLPNVSAQWNRVYEYGAAAQDPDQDEVAYSLLFGPAGMQVVPTTGQVTWTPSMGAPFSLQSQFGDRDNFGTGLPLDVSPLLGVFKADLSDGPTDQYSSGGISRFDWLHEFTVPSGARVKAASLTIVTLDIEDNLEAIENRLYLDGKEVLGAFDTVASSCPADCLGQTTRFDLGADFFPLLNDGAVAVLLDPFAGAALDAVAIDYVVLEMELVYGAEYPVVLQATDGRGGSSDQAFSIVVQKEPGNRPPVIVSDPPTRFDDLGASNLPSGAVAPTELTFDLGLGDSATTTAKVTLPSNQPPTGYADVIFVVDESFKMETRPNPSVLESVPARHRWVGSAAEELDAALEARGIGPNRFGLVGVSDSLHRIPVRELGGNDYYSVAHDGFAYGAPTIVTGDLDHDGDIDFVTGDLSVFLNTGDGEFAPGVHYSGSAGGTLAIGDYNNDGFLDILANRQNDGIVVAENITVFLGRGDGTLAAPLVSYAPITTGQRRYTLGQVADGDFNGDGNLDVAVSCDNGSVAVMYGRGDGTFADPNLLSVGDGDFAAAEMMSAGDLDADGHLDLLVANIGTSISILYGQGGRAFAAPVVYPTPYDGGDTNLVAATMADVNEDGLMDVVVSGSSTQIMFGLGNRVFGPLVSYGSDFGVGSGGWGGATVVADANADGHLDLVFAGGTNGIAIRYGDGTGNFLERLDFAALPPGSDLPTGLALADVDADGVLDALVGQIYARVSVLRGRATGGFNGPVVRYGSFIAPQEMAVADFDRDGNRDLAVVAAPANGTSRLEVAFGDGAGSFGRRAEYDVEGSLTAISADDLDRDGDSDLVIGGVNGLLRVFLNDGSGALVGGEQHAGAGTILDLQHADLNRDGLPDLVAIGDGAARVRLGEGQGRFGAAIDTGFNTSAAEVKDVNADGTPDLVFVGFRSVDVALGLGNGSFGAPTSYPNDNYPRSVVVGDVDEDGAPDILTLNSAGVGISFLRNDGAGHFVAMADIDPSGRPFGATVPRAITLADLNADANLDVVVTYGGEPRAKWDGDGAIVLFGNGAGAFDYRGDYGIARDPGQSVVEDINNDGAPDLLIVSRSFADSVSIALNDGFGDFGRFGSAKEFAQASGGLLSIGSRIDLYEGVAAGLDYARRPGAITYVVFVTANERWPSNPNTTLASLQEQLGSEAVFLNVVVDATFQDGQQASAIGVDAEGNAIVLDGAGGYTLQPGGQFVQGIGKLDYVDLAWSVGGGAWDLSQLEAGASSAAVQAFVKQSVQDLEDRIPLTVISSDSRITLENITGPLSGVGPGETATFDVRVTGDGSAHAFDLLFVQGDAGNVVGSIPVRINGDYLYHARAIDPDGDPLRYALLAAPEDAQIDRTTGEVRWRPTAIGPHTFRVEASDGRGGAFVQEFVVEVTRGAPNQNPVLGPIDASAATAGQAFSLPVTASDVDGDVISFYLTQAPAGLTIDRASGVIHWTPTPDQLGAQQITVRALDGRGGSAVLSQLIQVQAEPRNNSPRIQSAPLEAASVGEAYVYPAQGNDANSDPLQWSLAVAPAGMTLDPSTGVVIWTPAAYQSDPVDVVLRLEDGRGGFDLQRYRIQLTRPNTSPVFLATDRSQPVVGLPHRFQVLAQDGENDPLEFTLVNARPGMQIDAATGLIAWTPAADQLGEQVVLVRVSDGRGGVAERMVTFDVVAAAPNSPPLLASAPHLFPRIETDYRYAILAFDPDGDPLTFLLETPPAGMSLGEDGILRWRPTLEQAQEHRVRVRVADGRGGEAQQEFVLTPVARRQNLLLAIPSTPPITAVVGRTYGHDFEALAEGGDQLTWSLVNGPTGMSLDPLRGTLRWTPVADQLGEHLVIVAAHDGHGDMAIGNYTVTVRATNTAPQIVSSPPTTATANELYAYAVHARDADADALSFSLEAGPAGMVIARTQGIVQWVPDASLVGEHIVKVRCEDGVGGIGFQTYTLLVSGAAVNRPPEIGSLPSRRATAGQGYHHQILAEDPEGETLTYSLANAPIGMTVNAQSGAIEWTPSIADLGKHAVTIHVSDPDGAWGWQSFELEVLPSNTAPRITTLAPLSAVPAAAYRYDVGADDPDRDSLQFRLVQSPAGLTIDPVRGRIDWLPTVPQLGSHAVVVEIADGRGGVAQQSFEIKVGVDVDAPRVALAVDRTAVPLGERLVVTVTATDNIGVESLSLLVGGQQVLLDGNGRAEVLMSSPGAIALVASARDAAGNVGQGALSVSVLVSDATAPVATLLAPSDESVITAPIDVLGAVADDNLVFYSLSVAPYEGGQEREVARGTEPVSGVLGRFDPTLLANGSYWLRLTAVDAGGNESFDERLVHVAGELKLGNFTVSFTDLTVPVTGVPITVTRTYDSLQANSADEFGFGWRLEFRDVDLRTSVPAHDLEDVGVYNAFYNEARVYLTLPGGQREGFTFRPQLLPGAAGAILGLFKPHFEPDPGVKSRLSVPDASLMALETGDFVIYGESLAYNPASTLVNGGGHYYLATEDGLEYDIDAQTGDLLVVTDSNGATLTFTDEAIASSTGKRVTFERDPQGRITAVIDPAGQKVRYAYDVNGDLRSVVDREGNTTRFEYHPTRPHYLSKIVDALGRTGVRTEYDENGRLIRLFDAEGKAVEQQFDLAGSAVSVVNQLGHATKFEYDNRGNVTRETDAEGGVTQRTYDSANNLLEETDPNGKTTRFSYDARGNLLSETDELGRTTETTYQTFTHKHPRSGALLAPPFSRPKTTIDATGHTTVHEYDESGNLLSITGQAGGDTRLSYDPQGNLTTLFDGAGTTRFEYDGAGQVIRQVDALGREMTYTYDASGRQLTETKTLTTPSGPRTLVTRTEYDGEGRVVKSTDAEGGVTETLYDAVGNRIAVIDALGRATKYRYSDRGELTETILPDATPQTDVDNPRTKVEYDVVGQIVANVDELGRRTEYRYDKVGRKIETVFPDDTPATLDDNPRQQTQYDLAGRVLAQIDERGNRTEHRYDDAGQETETILQDGTPGDSTDNPRLKYEYDAAGRRVGSLDPLGRRTEFVYSDLGQLTTTTYADGATTTSQFDDRGQLVGRTDQLGRQTQYQYDASRRLSAVVDAAGGKTEYGYDELGNLVLQIDANGHTTRYEYDGLGRRTATVLPLGQRSTSSYDKVGNVTSTTDFNGQSITFDYDERNRLTAKHYPGQSVVRFTYTPTGQRASVVDARGETRYEYDARERLLARTDPDARQIRYSYDAAGNRTSLTAPSGTVQYTFDALNRTETVVDPEGGLTRYTYDPAGSLIRTQLPNGTSEVREYDELGRLLYLENQGPGGVIDSFRYTLDDKGQRTKVVEQDARTVDYLYDNLDRLVREAITDTALGNRTIDYVYDAVGNRQTRTDSAEGQTTYQYDANDRLLAEALGGQETKYAYDSNGNTLSKIGPVDRAFYEWDAENHLVAAEVTKEGATTRIENRYDADGLRVGQTVDGQETRYLIDTVQPYAQVHEEYTAGGIIKVSYVHGYDLVSQNRAGAKTFYHVDGLGSTRALSDALGAPTDRYLYDAFGRAIHQLGSTENLYLFAGEQRDFGLGLDYLRARYMDPGVGRFASRDPFSGVKLHPATLHLYSYALQAPTTRTDPSGYLSLVELNVGQSISQQLRTASLGGRLKDLAQDTSTFVVLVSLAVDLTAFTISLAVKDSVIGAPLSLQLTKDFPWHHRVAGVDATYEQDFGRGASQESLEVVLHLRRSKDVNWMKQKADSGRSFDLGFGASHDAKGYSGYLIGGATAEFPGLKLSLALNVGLTELSAAIDAEIGGRINPSLDIDLFPEQGIKFTT